MNGAVYYNELDSFAARWLERLIAAGHLPAGDVDQRSIVDVRASDVRGYRQCHFFAGIGGWAYAFALAGFDRAAWTGSCPCQPLSGAGLRKGHADERHLWPAFYDLIAECRPATVFGEQVAGSLGREWLAGVRTDLEGAGYALGCADLPAAGVGAPHIRQRLYWVADADGGDAGDGGLQRSRQHRQQPQDAGAAERLADTENSDGRRREQRAETGTGSDRIGRRGFAGCGGEPRGVGDDSGARLQGREQHRACRDERHGPDAHGSTGEPSGACWSASVLIPCADGKFRRVPANEAGEPEPLLFPLAYGLPNRVGILRGAGNAIVPQVAAAFIQAYCET